jgi:ABC-type sulfate transport system substrate-binding protein
MGFASNSTSNAITEAMKSLYDISQEVFKNLSHALELPWEKYLGEMHEFSAPSKDQLFIDANSPEWSTLVS